MKIYISADMEGTAGISSFEEVSTGNDDYPRFRKMMTQEVNAAVQGAVEAGASEITVNDSHGSMRNILINELTPAANLINGGLKPLSMMQGIDSSYQAVLFTGYHAMSGTIGGVNAHTYSGKIYSIRINDLPVGELGMNATYAGSYGVPVVFVSGDEKLAKEAKGLLGNIETAVVKKGITVHSGDHLPIEEARKIIKSKSKRAISNLANFSPYRVEEPGEIVVRFKQSQYAQLISNLPFMKRLDGYTIKFDFERYKTGYETLIGVLKLLLTNV